MRRLEDYLEANRRWAARMCAQDPLFFERLRDQQRPDLLWIGCSDSRLTPDRIIGKQPGEIFVHRNVGNVVVHTDMNCLTVLEYGIEVLGVHHVIVCGHYGCGGVRASMQSQAAGPMDNWLRHLRDVQVVHRTELFGIDDLEQRMDRLSELNVIAQVANVCRTSVVQGAWHSGRSLAVHGWIYSLRDGLVRDLNVTAECAEQIPERYQLP